MPEGVLGRSLVFVRTVYFPASMDVSETPPNHPLDSLPTDLILMQNLKPLGRTTLYGAPQPGADVEYDGKTYTILERRHRYQFRQGRYQLNRIAIYVQPAKCPKEKSWVAGQWILGDATCEFNARSPLIRCAVNPEGPCEGCRQYQPANPQDSA